MQTFGWVRFQTLEITHGLADQQFNIINKQYFSQYLLRKHIKYTVSGSLREKMTYYFEPSRDLGHP